jgi:hypothetical protein
MLFVFYLTLTVGFFVTVIKMRFGGWAPYLVMDGLILALIAWGLAASLRDRRTFHAMGFAGTLILFMVYSLVGLVSPTAGLFRGIVGYRSLFLCSGLAFAGFAAIKSERQLVSVYRYLIVLAIITAGIGLYQWRVGPSAVAQWGGSYEYFATTMFWRSDPNSRQSVFRAFSTFAQPGVFGSVMAYITTIALAWLLSSTTRPFTRILLAMAVTLMLSGIVVSGSRTALVEVVITAVLLIVLSGTLARQAKAITRSALVIGVALLIGNWFVDSVAINRFSTILTPQAFFWRWFDPLFEGVRMSLVMPFGLGLGYTGSGPFFVSDSWVREYSDVGQNVDSGIGAVATELGILGAVIYLVFMFSVARASLRAWRALPPGKLRDLMLAPTVLAILGLLMSPLSNTMRPSIPPAIIYWFVIGALMRAPLVARLPRQEMGEAARWPRQVPSGQQQPWRRPRPAIAVPFARQARRTDVRA